MLEFTCPGCLSRCVANEAFRGMAARCVVCGAFIRIPTQSGDVAFPLGPLPSGPLPSGRTASAPSSSAKPAIRPHAERELVVLTEEDVAPPPGADEQPDFPDAEVPDDDDLHLEDEPDEPDEPVVRETKPKRGAKKDPPKADDEDDNPGAELDGKLSWEDFGGEEPPAEEEEAKPEPPKPWYKQRRQQYIIGGSVLASLLIVGLLVAFSGEEPPPPPPPPPPAEEPPPPPPPPKKEAPPPKKEPPSKAPYPREAGKPMVGSAGEVIATREGDPNGFDERARGQLCLIRGTYARVKDGAYFLADSPTAAIGVSCFPPPPSRKMKGEPPPGAEGLQPGQGVLIRGWYAGNLRFEFCQIVSIVGPEDAAYLGKDVELVGLVDRVILPPDTTQPPSVEFEAPYTDSPVSVQCVFRPTERATLQALKPGQTVTIRGRCEGRLFRTVQLHNCTLLENTAPLTLGVPRVQADQFFRTYEADLLPHEFTRPNLAAPPIAITAEQLASAYSSNPAAANGGYRHKVVVVTGNVLTDTVDPKSRTLRLETGTNEKYGVLLAFTPSRFDPLKNKKSAQLSFRGICAGINGKFIRIENAELNDPDADNPAVRITAGYLPLKKGHDRVYDLLTITPISRSLLRFRLHFDGTDLVRTIPLKRGSVPKGAGLFTNPPPVPKWTKDFTKQKNNDGATLQFRLHDSRIEVRDRPPPPAVASPWWDPILLLGARKGESWSSDMPDGHVVTYTVQGFGKDDAGRLTVDVLRVKKVGKNPNAPNLPNPNPNNPNNANQNLLPWEEARITYAIGVGEVRRVITQQFPGGASIITTEMKIVEDDADAPMPPEGELKNEPVPPPKPKNDGPKGEPGPSPKSKNEGDK